MGRRVGAESGEDEKVTTGRARKLEVRRGESAKLGDNGG